jgi:hypothetical protein
MDFSQAVSFGYGPHVYAALFFQKMEGGRAESFNDPFCRSNDYRLFFSRVGLSLRQSQKPAT